MKKNKFKERQEVITDNLISDTAKKLNTKMKPTGN